MSFDVNVVSRQRVFRPLPELKLFFSMYHTFVHLYVQKGTTITRNTRVTLPQTEQWMTQERISFRMDPH